MGHPGVCGGCGLRQIVLPRAATLPKGQNRFSSFAMHILVSIVFVLHRDNVEGCREKDQFCHILNTCSTLFCYNFFYDSCDLVLCNLQSAICHQFCSFLACLDQGSLNVNAPRSFCYSLNGITIK